MPAAGLLEMKSPLEEDRFPFARDRIREVSAFVDTTDLLSLLKQREKEVHVAAELGKALLTENQDLKKEKDRLEEEYSQKLEVRDHPRAHVPVCEHLFCPSLNLAWQGSYTCSLLALTFYTCERALEFMLCPTF